MSPKTENTTKQYNVWKLRFSLAIQDPDTTGTRYHTTIFVETNADQSGIMYHVVGDITSGMTYQKKAYGKPEGSMTFHSKEFLGFTAAGTFPEQWDSLLSTVPPPERQKAFNMKTMKTELVKNWNPLTFYEPREARRPPVKCTEWAEQRALPALEEVGLLLQYETADSMPSAEQSSFNVGGSSDWEWDEQYQRYRRWSQGQSDWVWM
ncbi:hypothetical protein SPI_08848 [Niveomyces insectorum RCEF 264]|uniref:Uncharacterized protein n=1 Tax=Niveomyces insectorum RCEF 264 TaxID=1081102 RepID=A0A167MP78_9HYPO|nr:hypothetical protein SPI_08848 [Niveomyces insectorum RCEF 264]